ncbi:MAG: mreD [Dehalococcoidia bacterium]|nr:mreD [Dehalococcoidia bacterium]
MGGKPLILLCMAATLGALVQTSAFPSMKVLGSRPDLVLLMVVGLGTAWGVRWAVACCIVGGILLDMMTLGPVGASALAMIPVALLAGLERMEVMESRFTYGVLLALLGTVVYYISLMLIRNLQGQTIPWIESMVWVVLPSTIVNTATMPIVLGIVYLMSRWAQVETA